MQRKMPPDEPKVQALRRHGALHPRPEAVQDEAFQSQEFLDPRDGVQVKYEMLRRHRLEGQRVSDVARSFGVSRQTLYLAAAAFDNEGLVGLLPRPRGPRRAHKCTDEVLDLVERLRRTTALDARAVSDAVERRFGVKIHPRSLDRALARRKKKPRANQGRQ